MPGIAIGFCCKEFYLESQHFALGYKNSIGFPCKYGMKIDGSWIMFGNEDDDRWLKQNDIIGIGIIHFPANLSTKCFTTSNSQLLGKFIENKFIIKKV